jgi:hypothetical protein
MAVVLVVWDEVMIVLMHVEIGWEIFMYNPIIILL